MRYTVIESEITNRQIEIRDNESALASKNCVTFRVGQKVKLDESVWYDDDVDTDMVYSIHSFTTEDCDIELTTDDIDEDFDVVCCNLIDENGQYVADIQLEDVIILDDRVTTNYPINNNQSNNNQYYLLISN